MRSNSTQISSNLNPKKKHQHKTSKNSLEIKITSTTNQRKSIKISQNQIKANPPQSDPIHFQTQSPKSTSTSKYTSKSKQWNQNPFSSNSFSSSTFVVNRCKTFWDSNMKGNACQTPAAPPNKLTIGDKIKTKIIRDDVTLHWVKPNKNGKEPVPSPSTPVDQIKINMDKHHQTRNIPWPAPVSSKQVRPMPIRYLHF